MAAEKSRRTRRSKSEAGPEPAPESPRPAIPAEPVSPGEIAGGLEFDPGIISEIAVREARDIEGIAELTGGWRTKGVQVGQANEGGEEGYVLDLRLAVEYGVNCVALAETTRSRIASAIRHMTGKNTVAVNVHVTGIKEKGLREEHHEEGTGLGEEHGIDF